VGGRLRLHNRHLSVALPRRAGGAEGGGRDWAALMPPNHADMAAMAAISVRRRAYGGNTCRSHYVQSGSYAAIGPPPPVFGRHEVVANIGGQNIVLCRLYWPHTSCGPKHIVAANTTATSKCRHSGTRCGGVAAATMWLGATSGAQTAE